MNLRNLISIFAFFGILLTSSGCKEVVSGYILFIDDEGCRVKGMDRKPIEILWVFPGDQVIWINTSSETMTIEFNSDLVFGTEGLTIASGNRTITKVQKDARGSFEYTITPCKEGGDPSRINILDGTPKGKVTDPP